MSNVDINFFKEVDFYGFGPNSQYDQDEIISVFFAENISHIKKICLKAHKVTQSVKCG